MDLNLRYGNVHKIKLLIDSMFCDFSILDVCVVSETPLQADILLTLSNKYGSAIVDFYIDYMQLENSYIKSSEVLS